MVLIKHDDSVALALLLPHLWVRPCQAGRDGHLLTKSYDSTRGLLFMQSLNERKIFQPQLLGIEILLDLLAKLRPFLARFLQILGG